jgi:hypothetical protein
MVDEHNKLMLLISVQYNNMSLNCHLYTRRTDKVTHRDDTSPDTKSALKSHTYAYTYIYIKSQKILVQTDGPTTCISPIKSTGLYIIIVN